MPDFPMLSPDVVAEHKARRIQAAMLAQVGELGFPNVRINDIVRKASGGAGVSRKVFYEIYPGGKEGVFEAALEALVARLAVKLGSVEDWRGALELLAAWAQEDIAEARCLLVEAPGLQPVIFETAVDRAVAATALSSPRDELVVGGVVSILRRHAAGTAPGPLDVDGLVAFCEPHFAAQRQTPPAA